MRPITTASPVTANALTLLVVGRRRWRLARASVGDPSRHPLRRQIRSKPPVRRRDHPRALGPLHHARPRQAPAAPPAPTKSPESPLRRVPTSRDSVPWRLSDAGPMVRVAGVGAGPASETRHISDALGGRVSCLNDGSLASDSDRCKVVDRTRNRPSPPAFAGAGSGPLPVRPPSRAQGQKKSCAHAQSGRLTVKPEPQRPSRSQSAHIVSRRRISSSMPGDCPALRQR